MSTGARPPSPAAPAHAESTSTLVSAPAAAVASSSSSSSAAAAAAPDPPGHQDAPSTGHESPSQNPQMPYPPATSIAGGAGGSAATAAAEPEPAPPPVILIGRTDGSFDHGEEDGYTYDDEDEDADGPDADTTLHADVTEADADGEADADADGAMEFARPGAGSPRRGAREGVQEHPLRQASPPPWGDEDMDDDESDAATTLFSKYTEGSTGTSVGDSLELAPPNPATGIAAVPASRVRVLHDPTPSILTAKGLALLDITSKEIAEDKKR